MLADPGAVLREQRQGLLVGFAQFRLFFTEFRWLTGEKIRPSSTSASG
jgi:hypothetical protein